MGGGVWEEQVGVFGGKWWGGGIWGSQLVLIKNIR